MILSYNKWSAQMCSIFIMTLFIAILILIHMEVSWYMYLMAVAIWLFKHWYYSDGLDDVTDRVSRNVETLLKKKFKN